MQAPPPIRIPPAPGPPKMCKNCNIKAANPGFSYCSKVCGRAAKRGTPAPPTPGGTAPTANASPSGTLCENCKTRPAHPGHRHCGKTCARLGGRHKNPYSPPVIGYNPSYQAPQTSHPNSYGPQAGYGGYPSPSQGFGYPSPGPPYGYPKRQSGQSGFGGYNSSWSGRSRPSAVQRSASTPNRRRAPIAAPDFDSEDDYPSESEDERPKQRKKPVKKTVDDEEDEEDERDEEDPSEDDERGRRRANRGGPSRRPEPRMSHPPAPPPGNSDPLCIVCRQFPKHVGHQFCSKRCRDNLNLSQMTQNMTLVAYPVHPGLGYGPIPGPFMGPVRTDRPPAYNDIA